MTSRYAGLASRAIARLVDLMLLTVLIAGTSWLLQQFLAIDPSRCPPVGAWWEVRARLCGFMPYAVPVAGVVIPPTYRFLFYVITGQTPGMAVLGLRLLRTDGRSMGVRQAVTRIAIFSLTLGLGSVLIPVASRRRALHDMVAGTVVVYDWGGHEQEVERAIAQIRPSGS